MKKNKLITLFKQCCDNVDFVKKHDMGTTNRHKIIYPLDAQPFNISDKINDIISKGGYTVKEVGGGYSTSNYGRFFDFDGEPQLKLTSANVSLTLLMDSKHFELGAVEEDTYIEKKDVYINNFWISKYVEKKLKHKFLKRSVWIRKEICDNNISIWEQNQTDNSFDFCPRTLHRNDKANMKANMVIVTNNFHRGKASDWWFKKDINIIESSLSNSDMGDYDKVLGGLQHDHMKVCGGLLSFGDVWLWLDYEEYQELDKYYTDSIKKTHEAVLEQRLKETKKK